jgi:hypothetical protein
MSALLRRTDSRQTSLHVREVPLTEASGLQSITLSARASSVGGTSRPSAFAAFNLMDQLEFGRRLYRQVGSAARSSRLEVAYLFERRQVAGAVPNAFLKAREKAASEL